MTSLRKTAAVSKLQTSLIWELVDLGYYLSLNQFVQTAVCSQVRRTVAEAPQIGTVGWEGYSEGLKAVASRNRGPITYVTSSIPRSVARTADEICKACRFGYSDFAAMAVSQELRDASDMILRLAYNSPNADLERIAVRVRTGIETVERGQ